MVIDYKLPIVTPLGENSFRGKGGLPLDEACIFAKELEACGVDTLHVAQANHTGNMVIQSLPWEHSHTDLWFLILKKSKSLYLFLYL
mgnify:CR=1 FL=1